MNDGTAESLTYTQFSSTDQKNQRTEKSKWVFNNYTFTVAEHIRTVVELDLDH